MFVKWYFMLTIGLLICTSSSSEEEDDSYRRPERAILHSVNVNNIVGGGLPGKDFPALNKIPKTQFSCANLFPGYYADVSTDCQVFHICHTDRRSDSFLCPNGTIFHQQRLVCDWWYNVDCQNSEAYFRVNAEIGKVPERKEKSLRTKNHGFQKSNVNNDKSSFGGSSKANSFHVQSKTVNNVKDESTTHFIPSPLPTLSPPTPAPPPPPPPFSPSPIITTTTTTAITATTTTTPATAATTPRTFLSKSSPTPQVSTFRQQPQSFGILIPHLRPPDVGRTVVNKETKPSASIDGKLFEFQGIIGKPVHERPTPTPKQEVTLQVHSLRKDDFQAKQKPVLFSNRKETPAMLIIIPTASKPLNRVQETLGITTHHPSLNIGFVRPVQKHVSNSNIGSDALKVSRPQKAKALPSPKLPLLQINKTEATQQTFNENPEIFTKIKSKFENVKPTNKPSKIVVTTTPIVPSTASGIFATTTRAKTKPLKKVVSKKKIATIPSNAFALGKPILVSKRPVGRVHSKSNFKSGLSRQFKKPATGPLGIPLKHVTDPPITTLRPHHSLSTLLSSVPLTTTAKPTPLTPSTVFGARIRVRGKPTRPAQTQHSIHQNKPVTSTKETPSARNFSAQKSPPKFILSQPSRKFTPPPTLPSTRAPPLLPTTRIPSPLPPKKLPQLLPPVKVHPSLPPIKAPPSLPPARAFSSLPLTKQTKVFTPTRQEKLVNNQVGGFTAFNNVHLNEDTFDDLDDFLLDKLDDDRLERERLSNVRGLFNALGHIDRVPTKTVQKGNVLRFGKINKKPLVIVDSAKISNKNTVSQVPSNSRNTNVERARKTRLNLALPAKLKKLIDSDDLFDNDKFDDDRLDDLFDDDRFDDDRFDDDRFDDDRFDDDRFDDDRLDDDRFDDDRFDDDRFDDARFEKDKFDDDRFDEEDLFDRDRFDELDGAIDDDPFDNDDDNRIVRVNLEPSFVRESRKVMSPPSEIQLPPPPV